MVSAPASESAAAVLAAAPVVVAEVPAVAEAVPVADPEAVPEAVPEARPLARRQVSVLLRASAAEVAPAAEVEVVLADQVDPAVVAVAAATA
ncbi:MAG: hypothetical protein M5U09_01395 [Gammaproteobacteria bacterium]|nr:hypothetical protein [Gammaproteobacteria bacterium]